MKKFLLFAVAVLSVCTVRADEPMPLRMITEATFPPYEFLRGKEIVGIDVEICRKVAEKLGRPLVVEDAKFDAVIPSLISGKADLAAAGITVTEDRKGKVDFSVPYVTTGIVIVYEKSRPFTSGEACKGKRVGVQSGTTSDTYCVETLKQEPERFDSPAAAVAALKAGKVDLVIADVDPARNCVKGETALEVSGFITQEDYAVAVQKGNTKLLFAVNKVVRDLKKSGELARIVERFTAEADALKSAK